MTRHFRLSEIDCLEIAGAEHRLLTSDRSGSIWSRLDDSSVCLSFTSDDFMRLLSRPDVRLKRGAFSDQSAFRRLRCDIDYVQTMPPEQRAKILWQATCARTFLEAEARGETNRSEQVVEKIIPILERRVNDIEESGQDVGRNPRAGQLFERRRFPSTRWLLQWVRMYEAGGHSPLVFLRKRRPDLSTRKLIAEAEAVLAECVVGYLDRNEPTQQQIVENVCDRFAKINRGRSTAGIAPLPVPSARTVRRRIKALDPFEVIAQRKGIDAARRKFGFYEDGLSADYPLQRIEMDEWQIDICSLLGESGALDGWPGEDRAKFEVGRRWIYVALDCATRCVLGFRIVSTPNADDAIRTLNLIIQDKTPIAEASGCQTSWDQCGGIGVLATDQGSAFAAEKFRMAVADLGATYEAPPAGVPKLRGRIERLFRTFGQQLAPMLIGRTFGNPVERGDYPSEQWAALTDDELAQILTLFIVDIYHNSPHAGLKGETPANAWKRLSAEQGVTPPPDANHRRAVFGIPLNRKLDRHGVRAFGINYTCSQLQEALLRGASGEIPIRVDPEDLTYISICLGHEWFSAEAVSHAVWGLCLSDWLEMVRELRTRFREEAVLSEQIIRDTRKKIFAIDARARQLRRVQPPHLTAEGLDREERQLFTGLRIGPEGSAATGDLERPNDRNRPKPDDLLGDVITPDAPPPQPMSGGASFGENIREVSDDGDEWTFDD
ncbi:Mu transposase C-terminal domain-containing protein [Paracoccus saliphilus]|uniref:Transposase n=1 Tax=Paracoccus saliphilus TaxID=405559 RepID=A0AA46A706_9RHOB|nr:Mu transposase C-terminal domain-containing protein [Paracoccus saliphilus]WCR03942.1 transposase family protein [Paracoccus saliphilus]SIT05999.1 putative transposase [Paracoccus saliphilus]